MKSKYEQALEDLKAAQNRCLAELFAESCLEGENPHVQDEDGNWLTREQVYEKLLRGDVE